MILFFRSSLFSFLKKIKHLAFARCFIFLSALPHLVVSGSKTPTQMLYVSGAVHHQRWERYTKHTLLIFFVKDFLLFTYFAAIETQNPP